MSRRQCQILEYVEKHFIQNLFEPYNSMINLSIEITVEIWKELLSHLIATLPSDPISYLIHTLQTKLQLANPQMVTAMENIKRSTSTNARPKSTTASSVNRRRAQLDPQVLPDADTSKTGRRAVRAQSATLPNIKKVAYLTNTNRSDVEKGVGQPISYGRVTPLKAMQNVPAVDAFTTTRNNSSERGRISPKATFEPEIHMSSSNAFTNNTKHEDDSKSSNRRIRFNEKTNKNTRSVSPSTPPNDDDYDSQEDAFERYESPEDLAEEGVTEVKARHKPQLNRRSESEQDLPHLYCPRCSMMVSALDAPTIFLYSKQSSSIPHASAKPTPNEHLEPKFSTTNILYKHSEPDPIWQAEHAVELIVPKMKSSATRPASAFVSPPSAETAVYHQSSETSSPYIEHLRAEEPLLRSLPRGYNYNYNYSSTPPSRPSSRFSSGSQFVKKI